MSKKDNHIHSQPNDGKVYDERGRLQEPLWYALAVTTQREKSVRRAIQNLTKMDRWKDQIFDAVIPSYIELNAKGKEIEKLFYTQYVYVHMILNNETWHAIDAIDGFRTFLPSENEKPLTEEEVRDIFRMIGREQDIERLSSTEFEVEEVVTLNVPDQEAIHGKDAVIKELNEQKQEATVSVDLFGKETKMKVTYDQLNKRF